MSETNNESEQNQDNSEEPSLEFEVPKSLDVEAKATLEPEPFIHINTNRPMDPDLEELASSEIIPTPSRLEPPPRINTNYPVNPPAPPILEPEIMRPPRINTARPIRDPSKVDEANEASE